jgi:hypothetical protein
MQSIDGKGFVLAPDPWDEAEESMSPVERQARRDQIEGEAEAHQLHLVKRSLIDVAWEAMQEGHRIRITWDGGECQGVPSAALEDLVVIPAEDGVLAVWVEAVTTVEVMEKHSAKGSTGDRTLGSFVAFCRLVERHHVACHLVGGGRVDGTLIATARDHLYIRTRSGSEVAIARLQLAAVSAAGDFALSL